VPDRGSITGPTQPRHRLHRTSAATPARPAQVHVSCCSCRAGLADRGKRLAACRCLWLHARHEVLRRTAPTRAHTPRDFNRNKDAVPRWRSVEHWRSGYCTPRRSMPARQHPASAISGSRCVRQRQCVAAARGATPAIAAGSPHATRQQRRRHQCHRTGMSTCYCRRTHDAHIAAIHQRSVPVASVRTYRLPSRGGRGRGDDASEQRGEHASGHVDAMYQPRRQQGRRQSCD
jgi:hypothetical protein